MTYIVAIDPGPTHSAYVLFRTDNECLVAQGKELNVDVMQRVRQWGVQNSITFAIEMIASYGMAVGAETFETCVWIGRLMEATGRPGEVARVPRLHVKTHLCHNSRANDANIRQAILDRYGGKEHAIGKKSAQGKLYGVSGDAWSALAVALVVHDRLAQIASAA